MTINELIYAITLKHKESGITVNSPASKEEIEAFQKTIGFNLPEDFIEFYSLCNGFQCNEDIFSIKKLEEITEYKEDYGENWFHFSDYMISLEMWSLRIYPGGQYEIFNSTEIEIILTSSLHEFLERFLAGNIFEKGGLYDWHDEVRTQ